MQRIVLDTNCLLISLPRISPYRIIWDRFLEGQFILCVSSEIIEEYSEIISNKTTSEIANNVIATILNAKNTELVRRYHEKMGAQLLRMPHPYRMFIDEEAAHRLLAIYNLGGE